jgi:hypothetical protein
MPQLHGESDKVKESGELITVVTRDWDRRRTL